MEIPSKTHKNNKNNKNNKKPFPNNIAIHSSRKFKGREEEILILKKLGFRETYIPCKINENDSETPNKSCKTSVREEECCRARKLENNGEKNE